MNIDEFYEWAWKEYLLTTPSAHKIKSALEKEGEVVENDHIALRTFDDPKVDVKKLGSYFLEQGYTQSEIDYEFPNKNLTAKHFEKEGHPKVFISQLHSSKLSSSAQEIIKNKIIASIPSEWSALDLFLKDRPWALSRSDYETLAKESEYASWLGAIGYAPNHFTVNVNRLKKINTIAKMNSFLKEKGLKLNSSGGEIKGGKEVLLEQSSIMADSKDVDFSDGKLNIPTCYYEFAFRYPVNEERPEELYQGFVAASADKIFESTDKK